MMRSQSAGTARRARPRSGTDSLALHARGFWVGGCEPLSGSCKLNPRDDEQRSRRVGERVAAECEARAVATTPNHVVRTHQVDAAGGCSLRHAHERTTFLSSPAQRASKPSDASSGTLRTRLDGFRPGLAGRWRYYDNEPDVATTIDRTCEGARPSRSRRRRVLDGASAVTECSSRRGSRAPAWAILVAGGGTPLAVVVAREDDHRRFAEADPARRRKRSPRDRADPSPPTPDKETE